MGYLIDFNLAMDLKQKYDIGSKPKPSLDAFINISVPSGSASLVKEKNLRRSKCPMSNKKASYAGEHVKQKTYVGPLKNCPDKAGRNLLRAQGTDGSGITSAKDVTGTITPSVERLREPLPFRGRKELISLLHSTIQCPNSSSIEVPTSQRTRVLASTGKIDGKMFYLTPMPFAGGFLKSRGDGKHKREGPCVGTKGFRAPEELLDERYMQSWDLESWCKAHTKRPEFLRHIPKSFFDLIDKCLMVNPRNRISVEVLKHEFFVSCHEILRTQRMIRKGHGSDTAASRSVS